MKWAGTAATFAALVSSALWGQPSSAPLTFEVASIKPSAPGFHGMTFQALPGGGFRATGTTLKTLMTVTYDVREFQISGGPAWIGSDRYDIVAKSELTDSGAPSDDSAKPADEQIKTRVNQLRQRLQALLAERFHLSIHREVKEQPVYALVVSKSGSKLQPGNGETDKLEWRRNQITADGVQLQMLTPALGDILGRPVTDKTGLTGKFAIHLEWTPDPNQSFGNFGPLPAGLEAPPSDPNGPSIFTALQEQLGLRLESEKGPVDMVVIDRVEKPSEN